MGLDWQHQNQSTMEDYWQVEVRFKLNCLYDNCRVTTIIIDYSQLGNLACSSRNWRLELKWGFFIIIVEMGIIIMFHLWDRSRGTRS